VVFVIEKGAELIETMDVSAGSVEHCDTISAVHRQSLTYAMHCVLFNMNCGILIKRSSLS